VFQVLDKRVLLDDIISVYRTAFDYSLICFCIKMTHVLRLI